MTGVSLAALAEDLVADIRPITWNVGSLAIPDDLPGRLRGLGLRDPDPPLDAICAAMVLDSEPPRADDTVDVRRIDSLREHLQGLEIMLAAGGSGSSRPRRCTRCNREPSGP